MTIDKETLQLLLNDFQPFHSDAQMDWFITGSCGSTPYAMYLQALRELHGRCCAIKEHYLSRELLLIDIEELQTRDEPMVASDFARRRGVVKLTQKRMALEGLNHTIVDTEREFRRFYGQAVVLKQQVGALTPKRRAELDEGMWCARLKSRAALEILTQGGPSMSTLESATAMPRALRDELLSQIKNPQALLVWFEEQEPFPLKMPVIEAQDADELPRAEIQRMVLGDDAKLCLTDGGEGSVGIEGIGRPGLPDPVPALKGT